MPFQTSAFIFSSSPAVGGRFTLPITARRTVLWPINVAKFTDAGVCAARSNAAPMSRAEPPQLPATMEVTPMRMKFSALGCSQISSAWVWTSMNPGASVSPFASSTSFAAARSIVPTETIRPPRIATSARRPREPLPSTTVAPVITRSYCGDCVPTTVGCPATVAQSAKAATIHCLVFMLMSPHDVRR